MKNPCRPFNSLLPTGHPVDDQTPAKSPMILLYKPDAITPCVLAHCVKEFGSDIKTLRSVETGAVLDLSDYSHCASVPLNVPEKTDQDYPTTQLIDEDGYPTQYALDQIEKLAKKNLTAVFDFLEPIWCFGKLGFFSKEVEESGTRYFLSTAGWSGNESLIAAFQECEWPWFDCWESTRRGGHYEFFVPNESEESA